MDILWTK